MIISDTNIQPLIFLAVVGAGFISAVLYAGFYVIRYLTGFKRFIEMILDVIFVVISAGLYFMAFILYRFRRDARIHDNRIFARLLHSYFLLKPLKKKMPVIKVKLENLKKLPVLNKIFK
jgi:hypothetical protein